MKKSLPLASALVLLLIAPVPAAAQGAGNGPKARIFAKYDTNKNGVIDGAEIEAVRQAFAADPKGEFDKYDTNHDGKLDDKEIAEIKPPGAAKGGGKKKDDATKKAETEPKADAK